jgi:flagellar biosynthesis protein FliQ
MMRTHAWRILAMALVLGCGILAVNAAAYIDPGTGSYVLQIAIAAAVGLAFSIKVFWKKIAAFLRKTFAAKKGGGPDAS